jgi:hypothetical protein
MVNHAMLVMYFAAVAIARSTLIPSVKVTVLNVVNVTMKGLLKELIPRSSPHLQDKFTYHGHRGLTKVNHIMKNIHISQGRTE